MDNITFLLDFIETIGWDNVLLVLFFIAVAVLRNPKVASRLWKLNTAQLRKLVNDLHNGTGWQRRVAAFRLGKSGEPEAVPALIQAYRTAADVGVRRSAVNGLKDI